MFTGLVQSLGRVVAVCQEGPGKRLTIATDDSAATQNVVTGVGDSVAVNGCCLTVIKVEGPSFDFEAGPETLSRTNLGQLQVDSRVNLEWSLLVGDRMGGHFVSGHIDTIGHLDRREDDADWSTLWFRLPEPWTRQMVPKGSVAIDGVSLTLVEVTTDGFSVQLIPHTLAVTTLGHLALGGSVNIETDILAKYAQKAVLGDPLAR